MSNCPRCHSQWSNREFKSNCCACMLQYGMTFEIEYIETTLPSLCTRWNAAEDKVQATESKLQDVQAKLEAAEVKLQDVQAKLEATEAKLQVAYTSWPSWKPPAEGHFVAT